MAVLLSKSGMASTAVPARAFAEGGMRNVCVCIAPTVPMSKAGRMPVACAAGGKACVSPRYALRQQGI
ncbi:MAG: hypothetical protein KJ914_03450 [Gammaproteobacteria bacterium]|nr:hypothetical protein [Gammaproteobacteria bacterium]MBU1725741.1 hypothetical protein [Gammaproteobacteria bacterium]MBU2003907.1 hypothetical protein [Gammaproteobacteria bacterium]